MALIDDVSWRGLVGNRVRQLRADLRRVDARGDIRAPQDPEYAIATDSIELAHTTAQTGARFPRWSWAVHWASGTDVETAWHAIHEAEQSLIMLLPDEVLSARLPELRAGLTITLADDGRLKAYLETLDAAGDAAAPTLHGTVRQQIKVIKSAIDAASDEAHSNIRNYRNWLLIASAVVTLGLTTVAIAHALRPHFLVICQAAASGECAGPSADVGQIEAAGAVGGLLMALFALIRLTVFSGPVALPLWQSLVRVPAGAAAGLVGAFLLQGHVLDAISPQTPAGLLGYAVLFGAAPELILRFFDRKVNAATAAARSKNDPLTTVPPQ